MMASPNAVSADWRWARCVPRFSGAGIGLPLPQVLAQYLDAFTTGVKQAAWVKPAHAVTYCIRRRRIFRLVGHMGVPR